MTKTDKIHIDVPLVRRLVAAQFPQWTEFPVKPVEFGGWDKCDTKGGPIAGSHNFYRGGPLAIYDNETRQAIAKLGDKIDTQAVTAIWDKALGSTWRADPVWVHGDIAIGNLLVENGQLSAVIDFGSMGVGDPACDLVIAWTFFKGESRDAFRAILSLDNATWARARGWALWKALIVYAGPPGTDSKEIEKSKRVLEEILSDDEGIF